VSRVHVQTPRVTARVAAVAVGLLVALSLAPLSSAQAAETVSIQAKFTPDVLGAPSLVSGSAKITNTTGHVPSPIRNVTIIGPAGVGLDLKGAGTCNAAKLELDGPQVCPANSKAGSGGGMGAFELAGTVIREPFTMTLFLGSKTPGHMSLLIYVNALSPVSVQLVFHAPVIKEPKPYGLGFEFQVPPIETLPGASNASVESAHITIGATAAERKHFHVKGIVLPKRCPAGGFPVQTKLGFEDGSTVAAKSTVKCPKHH
jgi:hypothetical protein